MNKYFLMNLLTACWAQATAQGPTHHPEGQGIAEPARPLVRSVDGKSGRWWRYEQPRTLVGAARVPVPAHQPPHAVHLKPTSPASCRFVLFFTCHLSLSFFSFFGIVHLVSEPVIGQDGHTYEKKAIEEWIKKKVGPCQHLIFNHSLL
jgi:hypothetical protein